jgi:hypothetical protein
VLLSVIIKGSSSPTPFSRTLYEAVGTVLNEFWSQYSVLNTWATPNGTYL